MRSVRNDIQVAATEACGRIMFARPEAVLSNIMIIIIEEKMKLL